MIMKKNNSFKEKLFDKLGMFGFYLWYIIIILIYIFPTLFIGIKGFAVIFVAIQYFFPLASIVIWIWGLIKAISGPQDAFAIAYYIVMAILYLPYVISIIASLFSKKD